VIVLLYVALLAGEIAWQGVAPLIPTYIESYHLTPSQGSMMLAIASLGILLASLPAGFMTRRVSPRHLTYASLVLMIIGLAGQAIAVNYPVIIINRLLFGFGFGVLWVALIAWLADAAGDQSARVLSGSTVIAGLGGIFGPAYAGTVAHSFSLEAPFIGLSVLLAVLLILLAMDDSGTGVEKEESPPTRELLRATHADPDLSVMMLITIGAAVVWMTADFLVPLRLSVHGYNEAQIGVIFSAASLCFVCTSAFVSRKAEHWRKAGIVAGALTGLGVCTLMPTIFPGTAAAFIFLAGATISSGVSAALSFPFGLLAVERGTVTVGVMSALANIIWSICGLLGPTLGGISTQAIGDQAAFGLLASVALLMALLIYRQRNRPRPIAVAVTETPEQ
jgi:MFS family permease